MLSSQLPSSKQNNKYLSKYKDKKHKNKQSNSRWRHYIQRKYYKNFLRKQRKNQINQYTLNDSKHELFPNSCYEYGIFSSDDSDEYNPESDRASKRKTQQRYNAKKRILRQFVEDLLTINYDKNINF